MDNNKKKKVNKKMRQLRIRSRIFGTAERPRVSVFKSNKHIFVQLIDDSSGKTILSSKMVSPAKDKVRGNKSKKADEIGKVLAEKAKTSGISEVVFDRGGYKYHGRIKALADGLRSGGLKF